MKKTFPNGKGIVNLPENRKIAQSKAMGAGVINGVVGIVILDCERRRRVFEHCKKSVTTLDRVCTG